MCVCPVTPSTDPSQHSFLPSAELCLLQLLPWILFPVSRSDLAPCHVRGATSTAGSQLGNRFGFKRLQNKIC